MARTINSNVYWLSGILSGRSLDNIAPPVVSPLQQLLPPIMYNCHGAIAVLLIC
ncbi:MAG: hypothetical protein IPG99_11955 [Ignavibacteria bacterium]|nr:hypothetical protein [Ignavibacteria bacterium]